MRALSYVSPTKVCPAVFGAIFHCNTRQFVQRRIRFFGIFEHNLTYYTLSKLREGDLYVDVGANIGYFSLLASQCVGPAGKVIAVEADPETFKDLTSNLELNKARNVTARNIAATETSCQVKIERVRDNSGANSIALADRDGIVEGAPLREFLGDDIGRVGSSRSTSRAPRSPSSVRSSDCCRSFREISSSLRRSARPPPGMLRISPGPVFAPTPSRTSIRSTIA
jgi:FkbM family methyltransferase